jgi:hypothetical protein
MPRALRLLWLQWRACSTLCLMRLVGCLLLVLGWLLLLAALLLLAGPRERFAFVTASLLVEALGLGLLAYGYRAGFRLGQRGAEGAR